MPGQCSRPVPSRASGKWPQRLSACVRCGSSAMQNQALVKLLETAELEGAQPSALAPEVPPRVAGLAQAAKNGRAVCGRRCQRCHSARLAPHVATCGARGVGRERQSCGLGVASRWLQPKEDAPLDRCSPLHLRCAVGKRSHPHNALRASCLEVGREQCSERRGRAHCLVATYVEAKPAQR